MKKDTRKEKQGSFVQAKMVDWYKPEMLASIALKAIISGVFGNYADRRELQAALGKNSKDADATPKLDNKYLDQNDIWIDIVNDTGDGFNSTFAIATTVAPKTLPVSLDTGKTAFLEMDTQRGQILIFGGDEVYPFPTQDAYDNKFKIPYQSAGDCNEKFEHETDHPDMYAIPGNHDWYDGLGNFIKLFCQQRPIGIWRTKQHRSYFAIPLPHRYWIWATDIQLNSDIDAPQLEYFIDVAMNKMEEGDVIILITAEPAWIYNEIKKKDKSFERLQFFIDRYVHDADKKIGKKFKLAATITGDLHHYARYCDIHNKEGHQYITAGGGGAFLHLTHNLPSSLHLTEKSQRSNPGNFNNGKSVHRERIFPGKKDSKELLLGNFLFPIKNFRFTLLFLLIYFFFFWLIKANSYNYFDDLSKADSFCIFFSDTTKMFLYSPFSAVFTLLLTIGFYKFSDTNVVHFNAAKLLGVVHSMLQVTMLFFLMYSLSLVVHSAQYEQSVWALKGLIILITCFCGSVIAGLIMGCYLFSSNTAYGMHINEASSSLASPDYKNFLRLHVEEHSITIYPVGIKKVPRKWKQKYNPNTDTYSFSEVNKGKTEPFLIETPIKISKEKL